MSSQQAKPVPKLQLCRYPTAVAIANVTCAHDTQGQEVGKKSRARESTPIYNRMGDQALVEFTKSPIFSLVYNSASIML